MVSQVDKLPGHLDNQPGGNHVQCRHADDIAPSELGQQSHTTTRARTRSVSDTTSISDLNAVCSPRKT